MEVYQVGKGQKFWGRNPDLKKNGDGEEHQVGKTEEGKWMKNFGRVNQDLKKKLGWGRISSCRELNIPLLTGQQPRIGEERVVIKEERMDDEEEVGNQNQISFFLHLFRGILQHNILFDFFFS